jgi:hypothetical protein
MKFSLKLNIALLLLIVSVFNGYAQNSKIKEILSDVELDSMTFFVQQLTGEEEIILNGEKKTIYSRHKDQPGNEIAFQYIKRKFESYGLVLDSLKFSATGKNLIGIKYGADFPEEYLIIGAHYDNVVATGADDNASGTAAIMEAARVFSKYSFPYTIIYALWDEEEQGLIGSKSYASKAYNENDSLIGYINLDMLGWDENNDSRADLHVRSIGNSVKLSEIAIDVNSIYSIDLDVHIVNPGSKSTDHAAFWDKGFTAIGINEEYDNDFNPYWHSRTDVLGRFNLPFYEKCAKLSFATLAHCATNNMTALNAPERMNIAPKVSLFPNPANQIINIQTKDLLNKEYFIKIYNSSGKKISQAQILNETMLLTVSDYPPGIYFVQIESQKDNFFEVRKLIKR